MASDEAALTALEHRVRQRILRALAGVVSHTAVALNNAARAAPDATALELLSRADVYQALTAELARASRVTDTAVRAGYLAGARLGDGQARIVLRKLGHTVTTALPDGGDYLAAVSEDITRAFNAGLLDVQNTAGAAIDGVGGRARFLRRLTIHAALRRVARRLYVHASAAAAVAVHRGFSDAQAAAWDGYTDTNPFVRLVKTWHVRGPNPCASCLALNGTTIGINEQFDRTAGAPDRILAVYRDLYTPPRHPNCFPAGSIVSGPAVTATFKRWFDGEMVEIRTAGGRILTGTPNHPVLTSQGWIPLGLLHKGANLVAASRLERMLAVYPDDYQHPAPIEQVTSTFRRTRGVASVRMPVAAEDFHGDGTDGEVDVVWTHGLLEYGGQISQPLGQQSLQETDTQLALLSRDSSARLLLDRMAATTNSVVGGGDSAQPFLGRCSAHAGEPGRRQVAQRNARFGEHTGYGAAAGATPLSEALDALASLVALDEVIEVQRHPFSGHVYNIGTTGGWYTCNGILVHNCRCKLSYQFAPDTRLGPLVPIGLGGGVT